MCKETFLSKMYKFGLVDHFVKYSDLLKVSQQQNKMLVVATSYDNSRGTPNWVSWRLAKSDLGTAPRDNFYPDPDLPANFLRVTPAEYDGSGFDRGHMCPHGDRTASTASSEATFAMTNIIPQSHDVNTMAWESLEDYCRDLVELAVRPALGALRGARKHQAFHAPVGAPGDLLGQPSQVKGHSSRVRVPGGRPLEDSPPAPQSSRGGSRA